MEYDDIASLSSAVTDRTFVGSRSLCWKIFLLFRTVDQAAWPKILNDSRDAYTSLKEYYEALEDLQTEIWQDVERCMPENTYFRDPHVQTILANVLYVWCRLNKDIGYRQGMHEVLAPFVWVLSRDQKDYVEHDAFTLFAIVMQTVRQFYEPGEAIIRSRRVHEYYLHQTDPELAEHLNAIEILPQIFLIRWVRLVFGREFSFDEVLSLWDVLFAKDPELELIDLICVSMLLRIRWQLLEADYTGALTLLLRYPDSNGPSFVLDALYLRDNLTLDGGDYIIQKYSFKSPETTVTRKVKKVKKRKERGIDEILHDTAKGLYIQGEKWGVNRAIRDAVQGLQVGHVTPRRTLGRLSLERQASDVSVGGLLARVEALEQRNRMLAGMLKEAVEGQKEEMVVKVEFVRACLEDVSVGGGEELKQGQAGAAQAELKETGMRETSRQETGGTSRQETRQTSRQETRSDMEPGRRPRISVDGSLDAMSPSTPPRATLAESPYAWMLGEEKPKMNFVPSPNRPRQMTSRPRRGLNLSISDDPIADRDTKTGVQDAEVTDVTDRATDDVFG